MRDQWITDDEHEEAESDEVTWADLYNEGPDDWYASESDLPVSMLDFETAEDRAMGRGRGLR